MATADQKRMWVGRVISVLVGLMFLMSAFMKFKGGPDMAEGLAHMGLPASLVTPLAVLELACVAVYVLPATSILGAILLTRYLGGAVLTHLRVGDAFVVPVLVGVFVWAGIWLREPRLRALIPFTAK